MADFGFSVRDIVAIGMIDTHASTKWTKNGTPTNSIAKVHLVQGGLSLRLDGNPIDAFNYGQVFESRLLRDPIPEMTLSVLLSDSTNRPLDNRVTGALQLVEVGLKNPNSDKLLLQLWEARCININYNFPDEQFATVDYTYRGTDFRVAGASDQQIVGSF